jgi:acetylornithine deacetylase
VIITQIATAVRLTQQGLLSPSDIGFAYVVGEETDHIGAKYLEQLDFSVQMAIVGEPTRNLLCTRGMGLLKLEFTTAGIAGHSAFPESGRSAVHELVSVLDQLEITVGSNPEFDMGTSLYNIGVLTGGTAANVHAPSATATVLYRLAEASSAVISRVDKLLEDAPHTSYSIISLFEPIVLASCDGLETDIARFNSDARYLLSKAESTFLIGPGDIRVAHSEQEHITLESISDGIERMITLITTILKN